MWGGVVQRNRGYVQRNPAGSYGNAWVGYQVKDYNYDYNLLCTEPPGWPPLVCKNEDEIEMEITRATTGPAFIWESKD